MRGARYGVVLLMLTGAFAFAMVAPAGSWAGLVNAAIQGAAVLAALYRAKAGRRLFWIAATATLLTIGAALAAAFGGHIQGMLSDIVNTILLTLVPIAIVLEFRRGLQVTIQSVLAALCIYLVFGMFFAALAATVTSVSGMPYFVSKPTANSSDYTYFSFITLATVGYGDLVPALRVGRVLAVTEGLMGQLYLVTIVALLVGNLGRRAPRSKGPGVEGGTR